jgi:hypothetical protein
MKWLRRFGYTFSQELESLSRSAKTVGENFIYGVMAFFALILMLMAFIPLAIYVIASDYVRYKTYLTSLEKRSKEGRV